MLGVRYTEEFYHCIRNVLEQTELENDIGIVLSYKLLIMEFLELNDVDL